MKIRGAAFVSGVLASTLLAACAAAPERISYELGRAPASELIGLTQDEILQRLGGQTSGAFYLQSIALEDGSRIANVTLNLIDDASCAQGAFSSVSTEPFNGWLDGVFRDERLVGVTYDDGGDVPPDAVIVMKCVGMQGPSAAEVGLTALIYAPVAAIYALVAAPGLIGEAGVEGRRRELFAQVRLGEPLPGGLEFFVDEYGDVEVSRKGGDATLNLGLGESITLRDGRVQAIEWSFERCRLTAELSLACGD